MKRLTRKKLGNTNGKEFVLCNHREDDCNDSCQDGTCEWTRKALLKLKKYEDTGVAPEKLKIIDEEYSRMAKELSMLRQQNQWIPVSVELPDVPFGTGDDECPEFIAMIKGACHATTLKYAPDGAWFDDSGEVYEVVAWVLMPEPYKEQK